MPAFRRVDVWKAGPTAVGILVPPGPRTLVIVRPRSLAWDLLPAQWAGDPRKAPEFCRFSRDEAVDVARRLLHHLELAARDGRNPVETFGNPESRIHQIWVRTEERVWIVCRRTPGQSYQPAVFPGVQEAEQVGAALTALLWPGPDADQEIYFNTQQFLT